MFYKHILDLIWTYSESAGLNDIVKSSIKPIITVFILICGVTRMIDSAFPDFIIFIFSVKRCDEYIFR